MNNAETLLELFTNLEIKTDLPEGVEVLDPYKTKEVIEINRSFYKKYYNDTNSRILLLGINPGRFGAGITGIAFTDPISLETNLGIKNSFDKKAELSASFIHEVIKAYGGPAAFFSKFLLSAVSPLGYVKDRININYYDLKSLEKSTAEFIKTTLVKQFELTGKIKQCVCIGQGKNLKYLEALNKELKLFDIIHKVGHPRWVMQYKRKELDKHISSYIELLKQI